jgi:hypothetical protein
MAKLHGTHGLVAMTSAQHAEGRQFDPGWVYCHVAGKLWRAQVAPENGLYAWSGVAATFAEPSAESARSRSG